MKVDHASLSSPKRLRFQGQDSAWLHAEPRLHRQSLCQTVALAFMSWHRSTHIQELVELAAKRSDAHPKNHKLRKCQALEPDRIPNPEECWQRGEPTRRVIINSAREVVLSVVAFVDSSRITHGCVGGGV